MNGDAVVGHAREARIFDGRPDFDARAVKTVGVFAHQRTGRGCFGARAGARADAIVAVAARAAGLEPAEAARELDVHVFDLHARAIIQVNAGCAAPAHRS